MSDLNLIQIQLNSAKFSSIDDYAKNKSIVQSTLNQIDTQDTQKTSSLLAIIQPALTQLKAVQKQIQEQNELIDKLPLVARWKAKLNRFVNHFFVWIKNSYYQPPKLQDLIDKTNSIAEKCKIQLNEKEQAEKKTRETSQTSPAKLIENKVQNQTKRKQAPNLKEFNQQLDLLEQRLKTGEQKIDKKLILEGYTQFLESAKQLKIKSNHSSVQRLQKILNTAYVKQILDKMKKEPLSFQFISTFLEKLGFQISPDFQTKQIAYIAKWRSEKLEQDPLKLIKQMEHEFLDTFTTQLTTSQKNNLQPVVEKLAQFERDAQKLMNKTQQEERKNTEELILAAKSSDFDQSQQILEKWHQHSLPSVLPILMSHFLKKINIAQIRQELDKDKSLENLAKTFNSKINTILKPDKFVNFYIKKASIFIEELKEETQKAKLLWFERNKKAQRFHFDQTAWGEQQIFNEGVCTAINYRWICYLIKHPAQAIQSLQDLGYTKENEKQIIQELTQSQAYQKIGKANLEEEISGILPRDRKDQATYELENKLRINPTAWISPSILKRDHLKVEEIGKSQSTIIALIENIVQNYRQTLLSYEGGGIFDIGIYQFDQANQTKQNGHSIGMQIDPARNIYRFWDVNSGFYQYETLNEMKREFQSYMQAFYEGKYNRFYAAQYTPIDS